MPRYMVKLIMPVMFFMVAIAKLYDGGVPKLD